MKIGAIYNSFYDTHLLEHSISCLKPLLSYVVVVHQTLNSDGQTDQEGSLDTLFSLQKKGLVDRVIVFNPRENEKPLDFIIRKRNAGLDECKEVGCNYVMPMDADEFYDVEDVKIYVNSMETYGIETLYSPILTYYHGIKYSFRESYYVPSVYKVNDRVFKRVKSSVLCDPARKMKEGKFYLSELIMHHLTYRKDSLEQKRKGLRNSNNKELYDQVVSRFNDWKEGQPALVFGNAEDGSAILREVPIYESVYSKFLTKLPDFLH